MNLTKSRVLPCLLSISLSALTACGGGGSSSNNSDTSSSSGDASNNAINPELSGKIFIGNHLGPWLLDLKTGRYSPIPGTNWEDNPSYHDLSSYKAFPLPFSSSEYIETIESCVVDFGNDLDCIVTHDASGGITHSFQLGDITRQAARLSRDGNFIAVVVRATSGAPLSVNIYDRNGSLVRSVNPSNGIAGHQFDWLAHNEIIYASGQSLFISNQSTALLTLLESSGLQPAEPAVSPDGSQVAFILGEESSQGIEGTIWIMNTDGSSDGRAERITNENSIATYHGSPIWSPDGNYLFVVDSTSIEGNAYVIPSTARNVSLDGSNSSEEVIPVYSYYLTDVTSVGDGTYSSQFSNGFGSLAWIP